VVVTFADLNERYIGIAEAAAMLHVHEGTIRRITKAGELPSRLFGGRYLYDRADVERFKDTYDPRPWRRQGWKGRLL